MKTCDQRRARRAWLRRPLAVLLVAAFAVPGLTPVTAGADTTANTDDKSVAVPTGWWTYTGLTVSDVGAKLRQNNARLTDVERLDSAGRLAVTMVANRGAYAVPGWWWYVGRTPAQVADLLAANDARLIDIDPHATDAGTRFNVVMVANSGSTARAWSWLHGVSATQVDRHVAASGHRLLDLEEYQERGVTKYAVAAVANTGADAKAWQYFYGQTASEIGTRLREFGGRLVNLERTSSGRFNIILVRNAGTDAFAWWYYTELRSLSRAAALAGQFSARIVDVESYLTPVSGTLVRRYAVVMIDNANAATRRMREVFAPTFLDANGNPKGVFGAYLKRAGGSVVTNLNGSAVIDPASSLKALHHLRALRSDDSLGANFTYYDYPNSPYNANTSNACPIASDEVAANRRTMKLGDALETMMVNSDNRTTRGVALRYGGFSGLNTTAAAAGMTNTRVRQNIGCGYDGGLRNDTTMVDLGRLYEGVHSGTLLSGTRRDAFWNRMFGGAVDAGIAGIVKDEASKLGKSGIADAFIDEASWRVKGGSYGICQDRAPDCTRMIVRSEAGRLTLPVKSQGTVRNRTYVFGSFISDVVVPCFGCSSETVFLNAYSKANNELFREEIRKALMTW